jgi:hypothetical protein
MRRNKPHKVLLQKYVRITGITSWERWRYCFDFSNGVYSMDGNKLRIRPAEELYLYERLVLYKRPKETTCRYAIQRLRERHGADFLAEAVDHSPSGGVEGRMRREVFERVLQEYMEKDGRTGYEKWGYRFDFLNGSYAWDGEELRVTPREAVFLYERLILCLQGRHGLRRYTESNVLCIMRKKFGRRFLHEVFPNEETANDIAAILRQRAEKLKGSSVTVSTDG